MASIFDDMAGYFTGVLGEAIVYTRGDVTVAIDAVVQMPSELAPAEQSEGPDSVETRVVVSCNVEDLPEGYGPHDRLVVRNLAYVVRSVVPDGRGMVRLHLERAG